MGLALDALDCDFLGLLEAREPKSFQVLALAMIDPTATRAAPMALGLILGNHIHLVGGAGTDLETITPLALVGEEGVLRNSNDGGIVVAHGLSSKRLEPDFFTPDQSMSAATIR
jgi:hypothetical protein